MTSSLAEAHPSLAGGPPSTKILKMSTRFVERIGTGPLQTAPFQYRIVPFVPPAQPWLLSWKNKDLIMAPAGTPAGSPTPGVNAVQVPPAFVVCTIVAGLPPPLPPPAQPTVPPLLGSKYIVYRSASVAALTPNWLPGLALDWSIVPPTGPPRGPRPTAQAFESLTM